MILDLVWDSLVIGAFLAVAALAIDAALRRTRLRRFVWLGALGALLVLVAAAPARTPSPIHIGPFVANAQRPVITEPGQPATSFSTALSSATVAPPLGSWARSTEWRLTHLSAPWDDTAVRPALIAIVWAASSMLMLVLIVATEWRFSRLRRMWRAVEVDDTPVLVTPSYGPALVGFVAPSIVVPEWLFARPVDEQRIVVAHELEHRAAGDHRTLLAAWAAIVAMPWNPAVWFIATRLRLAVECDCDRRTIAHGFDAAAYGNALIELAALGGRRVPAIAFTGHFIHLGSRLRALTPRRTSPFAGTTRAIALSAVVGPAIVGAGAARIAAHPDLAALPPLGRIAYAASVNTAAKVLGDQQPHADQSAQQSTPRTARVGALGLHYFNTGAGKHGDDPITRDSAVQLLSADMVNQLDGMAADTINAEAFVGDFAVPPHQVTARRSLSLADGAAMVAGDGMMLLVMRPFPGSGIDANAISYGELLKTLDGVHMSRNAVIFIDSVSTTLSAARAVLDSGVIHAAALWKAAAFTQNARRDRAGMATSRSTSTRSLYDILNGLDRGASGELGAVWLGHVAGRP